MTSQRGSKDWMLKEGVISGWQRVADHFDLTFLPGRRVDKAHLFGSYQGCYFDLETDGSLDGRQDTRLNVTLEGDWLSNLPARSAGYFSKLLTLMEAPVTLDGQIYLNYKKRQVSYIQNSLEYRESHLRYLFYLMRDLLRLLPQMLTNGSPLVPLLKAIAYHNGLTLQPFAEQILTKLDENTLTQGKALPLICTDCLAHYDQGNLLSQTKAHCRICHQNLRYFPGFIVGVLDRTNDISQHQQDQTIRIGWWPDKKIIDFDRIEILNASDEDVERFVVQLSNDTDPVRRDHLPQITCQIAKDCVLSENTQKILRRTFKSVSTI